MTTDELIVGIDLGTTHSLVGAVIDGQVRLLPQADGSVLLPSVVGALPDGTVLVGRRARNRRLLDPEGTVRSVKRLMGKSESVHVGGERLTPPEVSALIIGALLDAAEGALGRRPTRAVVTVPAYFGENQRQATIDAGEIAGLEIARLVNEPTAAALSHQSGSEELVLVYDLGGGTFDVSILERDEDFMEVRASHGDTELGGDDVDQALAEWALGAIDGAALVREDSHALTRLAEAVERAKIALSREDETRLHEPFLAGAGASAVNLDLILRRSDLDAVAAPFIERTLSCIDRALRDASVLPSDLDRVLLVGGASQMPIVANMVEAHLDMPATLVPEPDRTVARGAALLAGRVGGTSIDEVLVDITPFTLSAGTVDVLDDTLVAAPVIRRGTVIPTRRKATYYTMYDDQPAIEIPVAQGESRRFEDNTVIGQVSVEDLPPSAENSPVDVEFRLDLSGVLHVSATHTPSGRTATTSIKHGPSRLTEQRRESARARVERLRDGPTPLEPERARSRAPSERELRLARSLLKRATRASTEELPAPSRERLVNAAAALERALDDGIDVAARAEEVAGALYDLD